VYLINRRVFRASGFALGLIITASLALAGEATFQLPVETHLGHLTLSPGSYRIFTTINAVYVYGNGKLQATLPLSVGTQSERGRSYLELVNVGGAYYVRKYNAGVAGQTFTFDIPKKIRREALAKLRATSVPVSAAAQN
jgi:hypothetical protein